jgi:hypothetical protein
MIPTDYPLLIPDDVPVINLRRIPILLQRLNFYHKKYAYNWLNDLTRKGKSHIDG